MTDRRHWFVIPKPEHKELLGLYNARKKAERSCLDMDAIYRNPRFRHLVRMK